MTYFPDFERPTNVLITQRIFPLHRPIRNSLIELYCRENSRDEAKNHEANKDCLVRVYLGKRKGQRHSYARIQPTKLLFIS
jgi:hypothetical protein